MSALHAVTRLSPQQAQEVVIINMSISRMRKPRHRKKLLVQSQGESLRARIRTQVVQPRTCSQPRWVGLHSPHPSRVESHCVLCRNEFNAAMPLRMPHFVPWPPTLCCRGPLSLTVAPPMPLNPEASGSPSTFSHVSQLLHLDQLQAADLPAPQTHKAA